MRPYLPFRIIMMFVTLFFLASCAEPMGQTTTITKDSYLAYRDLQTKAIESRLSEGVSRSDVERYLAFRKSISSDDIKDITRYDLAEDVYIYIVNLKNNQWYVVSGDYSSVPILAEGEGKRSMDSTSFGRQDMEWLRATRDYIIGNRLNESEEVQKNRNEWLRSSWIPGVPYRKKILVNHRDEIDTIEVESTYYIDTVFYYDIPHLTSTVWHQYEPFNNAVPLATSNSRCPVGCAVTAIAQLLYYTHYEFGFPNDIFAYASCDSLYNHTPYNIQFSTPSSATWDYMEPYWTNLPSNDPYTAALCALISYRSNTTYGYDNNSGEYYGNTSPSNIPSTLASFLLTGVSQQSFDFYVVLNEILNDRPVLISGEDGYSGHCYLIDGCKCLSLRITEVVTDMSGHIISTDVDYDGYALWGVNSGGDGFFLNYLSLDTYYPINRFIYVGWTQ